MTESEFLNVTDAVFARIDSAIDQAGLDMDVLLSGNVLELECADGSKIIVNRHVPNQELWIAARSGGYHYRLQEGLWCNTRGAGEFWQDLAAVIVAQGEAGFSF